MKRIKVSIDRGKLPFAVAIPPLIFLLAACSGDNEHSDILPEKIPVEFSTDIPETRSTEISTAADLNSIGVFASFTNGDFNASTATSSYMFNQLVEQPQTGTWTYSPVKYWPNNPKDRMSFFAYGPYVKNESGSNPAFQNPATAKGFPVLNYTVPAAEAAQTDLLASTPLMNRAYDAATGGKIAFTMKHALTKVTILIKSKDDQAGKKITAFSISSAKSGVLTYHAPADSNDAGFAWSNITGTETFTPTTAQVNVPGKESDAAVTLCKFFLLPQGTGSKFSLTYTYTGTTSGSAAAPTHTVTQTDQPFPSPDSWTVGTSVSYTFSIEKSKVTVTVANQPAWSDKGTNAVPGDLT